MGANLDYKVGQVLYALANKEMAVIPIRITERIVRETLSGEVVSYVAETAEGKKIEDLTRLSASFYPTPDEVKASMIDNATAVIQSIVDKASSKASLSLEMHDNKTESSDPPLKQENKPNESQSVTLPDGTVAKVNIPKEMIR